MSWCIFVIGAFLLLRQNHREALKRFEREMKEDSKHKKH